MAHIDRHLNIVIPVEGSDGEIIHVHSVPVARLVFERYFKVIAKTFAEIYNGGYTIFSGPRVAALLLKSAAADMGMLEQVEKGLLAEIRRLTNVVIPAPAGGWVTMPYEEALSTKRLSDDDAAEVDNALAFFTVASSMHKRSDLPGILAGASQLWGGRTTPLNCTEFAASLTTSTPAAGSGAKVTTSSLPS